MPKNNKTDNPDVKSPAQTVAEKRQRRYTDLTTSIVVFILSIWLLQYKPPQGLLGSAFNVMFLLLGFFSAGIGLYGMLKFVVLTFTKPLIDKPVEEKKWGYPVNQQADIIEKTLKSYGIEAIVAQVDCLPNDSVRYCIEIKVGTKIEDIEKRSRELALALASSTGKVEIEAPIPGRSLIGITVPNVSKIEVKEEPLNPRKTFLGKTLYFLGLGISFVALFFIFLAETLDENKKLSRQLLLLLVLPVTFSFLFRSTFDFSVILEYFMVVFITWVAFVLTWPEKKEKDKAEVSKTDTKDENK